MGDKKLHIEISIDEETSTSKIQGSGLDLIIAAAYIMRTFYSAFVKNDGGDLFKSVIRGMVNSDGGPIWNIKEQENGGAQHENEACGRGND